MISPIDSNEISDAWLVAYIDGALNAEDRSVIARALEHNPGLRERLDMLQAGGRPFDSAFDLLLEAAPGDRLQAMYADILRSGGAQPSAPDNVVPLRAVPKRTRSPVANMVAAAAIALALFGGGIATGLRFAGTPASPELAVQRGWTEAVAEYVSLFSDDTLAGMPSDPASWQRLSSALGLPLTREKAAAIPSLQFRGTQVLEFDGRPIGQLAFQTDSGKYVAICIIPTARAPESFSRERKQGLNIVHWITNGYAYMVIGDVPPDALTRISEAAKAQLS